MGACRRAIEELDQMRRLAEFSQHLKERLEDARPAEPPEPLPYAVPVPKFFRQCSPGNAVNREVVDCFEESTVIMPRLSPVRLCRLEHFQCDFPISLRHSRQHVRPPDAGHALIRTNPDSGIRQKSMSGIPSTRPRSMKPNSNRTPIALSVRTASVAPIVIASWDASRDRGLDKIACYWEQRRTDRHTQRAALIVRLLIDDDVA